MKEKSGMRSPVMPKDHHEKKQKQAFSADGKYASEFGNPESLDKMNSGLSSYVKKNKMKYE